MAAVASGHVLHLHLLPHPFHHPRDPFDPPDPQAHLAVAS